MSGTHAIEAFCRLRLHERLKGGDDHRINTAVLRQPVISGVLQPDTAAEGCVTELACSSTGRQREAAPRYAHLNASHEASTLS